MMIAMMKVMINQSRTPHAEKTNQGPNQGSNQVVATGPLGSADHDDGDDGEGDDDDDDDGDVDDDDGGDDDGGGGDGDDNNGKR